MHRRMSGYTRKSSGDKAGTARKRQAIAIETKVKIIKGMERGENMPRCQICEQLGLTNEFLERNSFVCSALTVVANQQ